MLDYILTSTVTVNFAVEINLVTYYHNPRFVIVYNLFLVPLRIYVESRGFDDPGGKYASIKVNETDYAQNKLGFNIVVIDGVTGMHRKPRPLQMNNFS